MTAIVHDSDSKSASSYKSTHSSRSSVLERAREYSRKIDENNRRAKSLERQSEVVKSQASTPRSQSTGRPSPSNISANRPSTRERAMASVRKDSVHQRHPLGPRDVSTSHDAVQTQTHRRPKPTTPTTPGSTRSSKISGDLTASTERTKDTATPRSRPSQGGRSSIKTRSQNNEDQPEAVVTPELLVDALSGHEDGLLAIAERLMEHYDSGYDAMGEAIIDAFADVQKLFQHVVEAAHMEGAAFEASRREEEMKELRKQAAQGQLLQGEEDDPALGDLPSDGVGVPNRHDEFIDQDVKDCLTEAIKSGVSLRNDNKHDECYLLYEQACQSASALLPVDSDHRGRLQLSIARAESMSPDRACAILRYAMDDVLRSGLRAGKAPLPDPSKRADVVLSKPKGHPSMNGSTGQPGVVQSSEEALASLVEEMKEILGAPVYENTPLQGVSRRFWAALGDAQKTQLRNEERLEQSLGKLKGDFLLARAEWEEKLTSTQESLDSYKRKYSKLKDEGYLDEARSLSNRLSSRSEEDGDQRMPAFDPNRTPGRGARSGVESVASLGSGLAQHARSLVGSFACSGINERTGGVLAAELAEGREDGRDEIHPRDPEWRDRRRGNGSPRSNRRSHSSHERTTENRYLNDIPSGSPTRSRSKTSRSFREYSRSPQRVDI